MPQELAPVEPITALTEKPLYDSLDARSLALIRSSVADGLNDGEIAYFLEVCNSLGLNPWTREVWAGKGKGDNPRLLIMVGRDGLLRKARENPHYRGYDSDVVRAGDTFKRVEPDPSAVTLRGRAGIVHTYEGVPKQRGVIVGAWCAVDLDGQPPRFFFADWDEYAPANPGKSPWSKQKSAMIEKCAISLAHRTTTGLSGVVGEGEEHAALEGNLPASPAYVEGDAIEAAPEDPEFDALAAELRTLDPQTWSEGRIAMHRAAALSGDDERRRASLDALGTALNALRVGTDGDESVREDPPAAPVEGDGVEFVPCAECNGRGEFLEDDETKTCPACDGLGEFPA